MNNEQYPTFSSNDKLATSRDSIENQNLLCELSHLSIIEVTGADAASFLQRQLINDVEGLTVNGIQLNGYCDAKGRLIALFYLVKLSDRYLMITSQDIAEAFAKQLALYVLMAKVEITPSSTLHCIGHAKQGKAKPPSVLGKTTEGRVSTQADGLLVAHLGDSGARHLIIGAAEPLASLWGTLAKDSLPCHRSVWQLLDIRLGIPSLTSKTVGAFVPQMMNLDLIDGLSFTKGCYPGQEVVARMHHLGKLKRRMYRLQIRCEEQPLPGDGIYSAESDSNESVGKIVNTVATGKNRFDTLAVMLIKHSEESDLYLDDGNETTIEILDLPYAVQTSEAT